MKLAFRQIDPFVKQPDPVARVILVYGPDDGLMRERAKSMGKTIVADLNDPFNAVTIDGKSLVEDKARLNDEAHAMSMMGGSRLIRVENADDKITPVIKDYLTNPSTQNLVILQAGELGPRSTLRLLIEKAANAAPIPCYLDDERTIANIVRESLTEQGFRIAPDAAGFLAAAALGDRARVRSEIEKLATYMGDVKTITLEDAQACSGATGLKSADDLVYACAGGQAEAALAAFDYIIGEGDGFMRPLRSLQNHFRKLHAARVKLDAGDSLDVIVKSQQPPIFFKVEPAFRAQVMRWTLPHLEKILLRLATLEADCKKTGIPAEILCRQAILGISMMVAKKRAA
jgi:DNA polymerase-3 subunit delta